MEMSTCCEQSPSNGRPHWLHCTCRRLSRACHDTSSDMMKRLHDSVDGCSSASTSKWLKTVADDVVMWSESPGAKDSGIEDDYPSRLMDENDNGGIYRLWSDEDSDALSLGPTDRMDTSRCMGLCPQEVAYALADQSHTVFNSDPAYMLDPSDDGHYACLIGEDASLGVATRLLDGDSAMLQADDVEEQYLRSLPQIMASGDSIASGLVDLADQSEPDQLGQGAVLPALQCFDDLVSDEPESVPVAPSSDADKTETSDEQLYRCMSLDTLYIRYAAWRNLRKPPAPARGCRRKHSTVTPAPPRAQDTNYNLRRVCPKSSCPCCIAVSDVAPVALAPVSVEPVVTSSVSTLAGEFTALHNLRRHLLHLMEEVLPRPHYPPLFSARSPAVDTLVSDVTAALAQQRGLPARVRHTLVGLVLCKQPAACLRRLRRSACTLLTSLLPHVELDDHFDQSSAQVDDLLSQLLLTDS